MATGLINTGIDRIDKKTGLANWTNPNQGIAATTLDAGAQPIAGPQPTVQPADSMLFRNSTPEKESTGLLAGMPATPAPTAAPVTPQDQGTTLDKWNVTDDQSVQGQVEKIIKENSPLQQQAEGLATQRSNARGLTNTSMGVEAGMNALYANALPIATQDASTNATAAQFNAGQNNALSMLNQQQKNTLEAMAKTQGYTLENMTAQQINDLAKLDKSIAGQTTLANIQAASSKETAEIGAHASMTNAATAASAQLAIGQLNANTSIANNASTIAANQLIAQMQANTSTANTQASIAGQQAIAELNNQYGQLSQASASATSILNNTQNRIAAIVQDPSLNEAAKQTAVDLINGQAKVGLGVVGALAGDVDLASFMNGLFV